jgi:hypothetical protein
MIAWLVQETAPRYVEVLGAISPLTTLGPSVAMPGTLEAEGERDRLKAAVANMAHSNPPIPFAKRFLLTTDIVHGGQSVVVFARGNDAGLRQFAIKCVST